MKVDGAVMMWLDIKCKEAMKYAELWMEGTIAMVPFKATFAIAIAIARPRGK